MTDFSSGKVWSTVSFSAINSQVCRFNSRNENYWHEDYDKWSYWYKRIIIYGGICIKSCGGWSKTQQRDIKSKSFSKFHFFSKLDNFWSIRRYRNILMKLVKVPVVMTRFYFLKTDAYIRIPIMGRKNVWFWKWIWK